MVYNTKYKVWLNKDGVCLKEARPRPYTRSNKGERILVPCGCVMKNGYITVKCNLLHRIMWETFMGEIPPGMCIDHIDCNKQNNALINLQLVTYSENNKLTYTRGRHKPITTHSCTVWSSFGKKYKEHFGMTKSDDVKKYYHERHIFRRDGKCSWE